MELKGAGTRGTGGLVVEDVVFSVPDGQDRERTLLDHISLVVAPGELVVIQGASGSGKSTLLAVAGLLRRPDAGDVIVGGMSTAALREKQRTAQRRNHVGIVYQSSNLIPTLTALEQLELVGHIGRRPRGPTSRMARTLLGEVGLSGSFDKLPSQLSGGERQRVGIARALMAEPTVLLADEPTASLDPELSVEVAELLAAAAQNRDVATVVVTHDVEPLRHADRAYLLSEGRLASPQAAGR